LCVQFYGYAYRDKKVVGVFDTRYRNIENVIDTKIKDLKGIFKFLRNK
jgi:hypothetical protein